MVGQPLIYANFLFYAAALIYNMRIDIGTKLKPLQKYFHASMYALLNDSTTSVLIMQGRLEFQLTYTSSFHAVSSVLLDVVLGFLVVSVDADLFIILLQRRQIFPGLGEFSLFHTLTHIPDKCQTFIIEPGINN